MLRVAIIGAGPAGLVSAKECLEQGLDVTVFEKTGRKGGLWNAGAGVWPDMRTNLSKESCAFPDFPWPEEAPLFPSQQDVLAYLSAYTQAFDLEGRATFHYETPVQKVKRGADWEVETKGAVELFDHVIIGSGFFNKPYIPDFKGFDQFQGNKTHSSQLSPFAQYEGRRVVVIGNAFSGCDIAVGLAQAGADVTQIYRRPVWILTRELMGPNGLETIDSAFYRVSEEEPDNSISLSERYRLLNDGMAHICAVQNAVRDGLYVEPDSDAPPHVTVTDGYIEAVRSGQIDLKQMQYIEMNEAGLRGVQGAVEDVIFATGFETDLSFLDQEVLDNLYYRPSDRFMPLALHDGIWGQDLEGLAMIGQYKGPFFLTMALQAKWAALAFAQPETFKPSEKAIRQGVEAALELRALDIKQRPQFPMGDYVGYVQTLAKAIRSPVSYEPDQRVLPVDFSYRL